MRTVPTQEQSTTATSTLYLAFELGTSKWVVAYGTSLEGPRRRVEIRGADGAAKTAVLRARLPEWRAQCGLAPDGRAVSCYEAGRDGFWVHRMLATLGVSNTVVDASSIEVPRRARRAKTDRLDAGRPWRLVWRVAHGERDVWRPVRVPSAAEEDARHAARQVATLVAERTRWRNRVHAALALVGIRVPLTATFGARIATLRDWAGAPLGPGLQARLTEAWGQVQAVEQALRQARRQETAAVRCRATRVAAMVTQLQRVRGVARHSATLLAQELFIRDLKNRREVGALSGLVPVPYASGDRTRDQGVSRCGPRHTRGLAVELAWAWCQWQPLSALTRWYEARYGLASPRQRKIGIVALARKLLIALWRYVTTGQAPAGAILRLAA